MFELLPMIGAVAGGIVALVFAVLSWRAFQAARVVSGTPPRPIAELIRGPAEVKGVLHGEGKVEAPMSRRSGLYYCMRLEQHRRGNWEVVLEKKEAVDVWLDDGSGQVRVFPQDVQVIVSSTKRALAGVFEHPSKDLTALLEKLSPAQTPNILGPFVRWREEVLEQGDTVHAMGDAQEPGAEGERWELRGTPTLSMLTDRDDSEVVRIYQRRGQQYLGGAILGGLLLSVGLWGALG